ncbi:BrnT family toxin [Glaciimonas immobilis]|nr:BrnT family toxin [Glaciimonas immobilis]
MIESGQTVTFEDNRFNYDEPRFITLETLARKIVAIITIHKPYTEAIFPQNEKKSYKPKRVTL